MARLASFSLAVLLAPAIHGSTASAAGPPPSYPNLAPVQAYLMDRDAEIALARSAAPPAISQEAAVMVLTPTGFQTAIAGKNGFLCMVARGLGGAFDWPEKLNPKIRGAECLNPPAARSVAPITILRTAMLLTGHSTPETIARIKTAFATREFPPLETGAMSYMMSKSSYLTDDGEHDMPHVMFFAPKENADWGANLPGSPLFGANTWFFTPGHEAEMAGLPVLTVFIMGADTWSDGTPAPMQK